MEIEIPHLSLKDTVFFFWFERNRTFHLPFDVEKRHVKLPSIIPGYYEFIKHNSENLILSYQGKVLLQSNERIIYFQIKKEGDEFHAVQLQKEICQPFKKDLKTRMMKQSILYYHIYWYNLHYLTYHAEITGISFDIYLEQLEAMLKLMASGDGLSCPICRNHLGYWLKLHPIKKCTSFNECIDWFITLHNDVNKRNKKKIFSKEECDVLYKKEMNINLTTNYNISILNLLEQKTLVSFIENMKKNVRQQLYKENRLFQYDDFTVLSRT